jgi:DNA-binding beta-propeller fold protein YncE
MVTETGTMPQGAAASPDGKTLAVVESGFNPPTLGLYRTADLKQLASIPLEGAFGRPVWVNGRHVLVAGANADALLDVDLLTRTVQAIAMPKQSYPTAIATRDGRIFAVATDGDASVRVGTLPGLPKAKPVRVGGHIGGLAFTSDGKTLFASNRASDYIAAIDTRTLAERRVPSGLHPSDVLVAGGVLYVAESDADSVGVYDAASTKRLAGIFVGDRSASGRLAGVSPNALAIKGATIFVSLGAANSVGVIRSRRFVGRIAAGWYPTDVVPVGDRLYVVNGKGEGTRPNPYLSRVSTNYYDYVASIEYGSIRAYDVSTQPAGLGNPQGAQGWQQSPPDTVVRRGGPIKHIFFILKENRSYDQVLGDVSEGNGDPKLTWFGARVTPNEHALAARFGLFDNVYASGEVSESGHNWSDAAYCNDYVERVWPVIYGRRGANDDTLSGSGAPVPRNGYIWQAAQAAHVSFRDYGELTDTPNLTGSGTSHAPSLQGLYDPHYVGWNLSYSDLERVKEWRREFDAFVRRGTLPQLEWIWLPNDHTYGSRPGKLSPVAYVATNDYALGLIVEAISHSSVWRSSAIFIIEDDAQDGPDHLSDQRTTMFLASPHARGGVVHAHYSTVSLLATIELMLGLKPLSTYDAMAVPLYGAFSPKARMQPFDAIAPKVSLTTRNGSNAYGAKVSDALDFSRPDANPPGVLLHILAHNR